MEKEKNVEMCVDTSLRIFNNRQQKRVLLID